MEFVLTILEQIFDLLNEMSPYLLLGFLLAGLMHVFVPGSLYSKYLSSGSFRSVLCAAIFGIPLPLCSCGVIPTAMSLRREGASKGSVVSFLIATPQTGVDSIIATFSLMGLPFAIVRPIAALFTAVFGGQFVNVVNRSKEVEVRHTENNHDESHGTESCHSEGHCACGEKVHVGFMSKLSEALHYAFVEMMEDIGKWLIVGLVVAGLITILVPDSFFAVFQGNTFLSMLLVLCIAVPMYICATGSIPIAVALMMKGLTPGSALVLLMAGPACNVASILVINKVLGRRTLFAYLASIILGSVLFGVMIDQLLPAEWFIPTMMPATDCCHEHGASWWSIASSILLLVLLLNALRNHFFGHSHCHCHEHDHGCCGADSCDDEHHAEGAMLTFKIVGMNCNHCRSNAIRVIQELDDVKDVDVDLSSGKATVVGDVSIEQVQEALSTLGFSVEQ